MLIAKYTVPELTATYSTVLLAVFNFYTDSTFTVKFL
jgi:hypothetical protein